MKTWQAGLAQIGIGLLRVATAVPLFDKDHPVGPLGNWIVQIAAQGLISVLDGYVASQNSHTAPNGAQLAKVEVPVMTTLQPGQYVSRTN